MKTHTSVCLYEKDPPCFEFAYAFTPMGFHTAGATDWLGSLKCSQPITDMFTKHLNADSCTRPLQSRRLKCPAASTEYFCYTIALIGSRL